MYGKELDASLRWHDDPILALGVNLYRPAITPETLTPRPVSVVIPNLIWNPENSFPRTVYESKQHVVEQDAVPAK